MAAGGTMTVNSGLKTLEDHDGWRDRDAEQDHRPYDLQVTYSPQAVQCERAWSGTTRTASRQPRRWLCHSNAGQR